MKMNVFLSRALVLAAMFAMGACNAGEMDSKNTRSVSFTATERATASDVGLPTYPGAKPYKDDDQASSAAHIGFSTPLFGLNIVAVKFETADAPKRVATFYKDALAKYGLVLDCTDAEPAARHGDELACDSEDSKTDKLVYKVGVKKNLRVVAIKPNGSGSRFSLVHVHVQD